MKYKNYSREGLIYEASIDVLFSPKGSEEYSDLITMWIGDFETIMDLIPLNEDDMYVALAYHYQVDSPWEELENEPWEVDELETSFLQLIYVRNILSNNYQKDDNVDNKKIYEICTDICDLFKMANLGEGKVFIKYYY